jgi:hypothetical protein
MSANKEEDEDVDNEGVPTLHLVPTPSAVAPEEVIEEGEPIEMVPKQEAPVVHEVILADDEPEMP